jgi:hypothetical protein
MFDLLSSSMAWLMRLLQNMHAAHVERDMRPVPRDENIVFSTLCQGTATDVWQRFWLAKTRMIMALVPRQVTVAFSANLSGRCNFALHPECELYGLIMVCRTELVQMPRVIVSEVDMRPDYCPHVTWLNVDGTRWQS